MMGLHRVALVVPTMNEAECIGPALARVPREIVDRIILADGGSRDGTVDAARAGGAEIVSTGRGYGRACWEGARAAATDCEIIAFMDGDGSDRPEELSALVGPIARGHQDFVIGSRTRGRREPGSMNAHQVWAGHAVGRFLALATGVVYTDMCAFRAIRADSLLSLGMQEMTFGWNLEMQIRAARARLRILEVPVPYGVRTGGRSKVAGTVLGTAKAGLAIASTLVRVLHDTRPMRPRNEVHQS